MKKQWNVNLINKNLTYATEMWAHIRLSLTIKLNYNSSLIGKLFFQLLLLSFHYRLQKYFRFVQARNYARAVVSQQIGCTWKSIYFCFWLTFVIDVVILLLFSFLSPHDAARRGKISHKAHSIVLTGASARHLVDESSSSRREFLKKMIEQRFNC